jgi:hypothetical protein
LRAPITRTPTNSQPEGKHGGGGKRPASPMTLLPPYQVKLARKLQANRLHLMERQLHATDDTASSQLEDILAAAGWEGGKSQPNSTQPA